VRLATEIGMALAAAVVTAAATVVGMAWLEPAATPVLPHTVVAVAPGEVRYRPAGDYTVAGRPAAAPLRTVRRDRPLVIMTRQVTRAEYAACVSASACPAIAGAGAGATPDRPMVGVSFRDAVAYAEWMTRTTGVVHRLPTDDEWVFAAAEKADTEAGPLIAVDDPIRAWLARYEAESSRAVVDPTPQPVGAFGANSRGLVDMAGNVWEWTTTCFERSIVAPSGETRTVTANCGVRVVQGQHRSYMTDFIRDPKAGGCAAGLPPANLGIRLVVETDGGDGGFGLRLLDRMARGVHGLLFDGS
jgi:formylglycine-generating enzyme required for sulfatase activity